MVKQCGNSSTAAIGHPRSYYYTVIVFFKIDFPILGNIFNLDVQGETSTINLPNDGLLPDPCA